MRGAAWGGAVALCVLAVACSKGYGDATAPPTGDDDDTTIDAGANKTTTTTNDAAGTPPVDAATNDAAGPQPSTTCPAAPPASTPPYVSPPLRGNPCTLTDLNTYLANEGKPFDTQKSLMATENASCAACVFTVQSDTTWGPVTKTDDGRAFIDFGLCYRYAGGSDACGKSGHDYEWCKQKVCNVCLDGQNETDCTTSAEQGVCGALFTQAQSDCSDDSAMLQSFCLGSGDVVKTMCGKKGS